ncbi:MAG: hypothetical protein K8S97_10845 [Anaerolineae bacterium]|nr:hypothetical protein [Anaerolineae bacterium]
MSTTASSANPVRAHRRAVFFKIILPVALPFVALIALCIALAVGVATGSLDSAQITTIMSLVFTLFIALPMVLLCIVPVVLMIVIAYFGGWTYAHTQTPIRFARRLSEQIAVATNKFAPRVVRPLVGLNVQMTRLENTVRNMQRPSALPTSKETDDE